MIQRIYNEFLDGKPIQAIGPNKFVEFLTSLCQRLPSGSKYILLGREQMRLIYALRFHIVDSFSRYHGAFYDERPIYIMGVPILPVDRDDFFDVV